MTIGIKKFKAKHIYYLYSAVNGLMFTLAFTLGMVYQVRTVGLNPFQLVVVGTTLEFSALIFEIPTGIVADLVSRRASVIFGSFVTGVARLIEGLVPTYGGMLMAQVTWGFGYTFISGALTAWITDEVGEDKVEAILLEGTQISAIAEGVGIVLAVLLSMIALKWPILLSGVLFILLAGLMILFMPETNFEKSSEGPIRFGLGLDTFKQSFGLIRASRFLLMFALVIFLIGLSSEGFDRLYTPLMLSHLDLNVVDGMGEEMWFGILRGGVLVMSLGLTQLVKHWRTLENSPKLGMILAGMMIVQIIGVLVVANTHALWVFFPCVLVGEWVAANHLSVADCLGDSIYSSKDAGDSALYDRTNGSIWTNDWRNADWVYWTTFYDWSCDFCDDGFLGASGGIICLVDGDGC